MRVLGIDPGFGRIGWGLVVRSGSQLTTPAHGLIETPPVDLMTRLAMIDEQIGEVMDRCAPDALAVEKLLFAANRTTALDVSKALGVILLAGHRRGLQWQEFTPPEVKLSVTGTGRATKDQVAYMACRLLGLAKAPKPDDVADALGIALALALRSPQAGKTALTSPAEKRG